MSADYKKKTDYQPGENDVRPWGRWEVLAVGTGFVVKKIDVNPGQKLSLQSHQHRSEHWTILWGKAAVTLDTEIVHLSKNNSIFIPLKTKHRIHNIGEESLSFIEIQTGEHLDENDITRYDDDYGRS